MSTLKDRMARQLKERPKEVFTAPPATYGKRLTLDLTVEDHQALKIGAAEATATMAGVLRALLALWRDDAELARRVREYLAKQGD
jgi:hypothetical protein